MYTKYLVGSLVVISFFVVAFFVFRTPLSVLPVTSPALADMKAVVLRNVRFSFPTISRLIDISASDLPRDLVFLVLPQAERVVYQRIEYGNGREGYSITYDLPLAWGEAAQRINQASSTATGWNVLYASRTDLFSLLEIAHPTFDVRVAQTEINSHLVATKIQVITKDDRLE